MTGWSRPEPDEPFVLRRRAVSDSTLTARDAAALVAPINERLGAWQAEAVRLATSARRMREAGRRDPAITEAVLALLGFVEEQAKGFEAIVVVSPPNVAQHSRIADTRQALSMVAERLREALPKS